MTPSYSEVVQRLPSTLKYAFYPSLSITSDLCPAFFLAADTCAVLPLLITLSGVSGHHLHLDALTLGCIAGQTMCSGLGVLVLP
ncbi:hypothetical protein D9619_010783 [Psilocybe cf. subviscida]|uniref:Uncharacterized protein n=1 Tax=Psilocybe cf. subviscida TaxID=2480587 RepID=A0A8H5F049_9AGAR|nr:hypothetical protein D9619_010783 [Psilocybe cf. subviscida]